MNKTKTLFRIMIKSGFDVSNVKMKTSTQNPKDTKKKKPATGSMKIKIVVYSIVLTIVVALEYLISYLASKIFDQFLMLDQEPLFIALSIIMLSLFHVCFGFAFILQEMYHSRDIVAYMYLPIKKSQILIFRFIKVIIIEDIIGSFFLFPFLVVYGLRVPVGLQFIPKAVLILLFLPIIPVTLVGIITMLLMNYTKRLKSRKAVLPIGFVSTIIGVQFIVQFINQGLVNPNFLPSLIKPNGFIDILFKLFYGIEFAANALIISSTDGILKLGVFLLINFVAFGLFLIAGKILYYKGLIGIGEEPATRIELSHDQLKKKTSTSSKIWTYLKKEFRELFRSPISSLQVIIMQLVLPGFVVLIFFLDPNIDLLFLVEIIDKGLIISIISGLCVLFSVINPASPSSISREGTNIYFMKFLPIPIQRQLFIKCIPGFIIGFIQCSMICTAFALCGIPFDYVIICFFIALGIIVSLSMTGIILDVKRPKLNWANEQSAMFGNPNFLFFFIIGVIYIAIAALPIILLNWNLSIWEYKVSLIWFVPYIFGIFGISNILQFRWIYHNGKQSLLLASS
jgi:ABC-2 type transport system permease protein